MSMVEFEYSHIRDSVHKFYVYDYNVQLLNCQLN